MFKNYPQPIQITVTLPELFLSLRLFGNAKYVVDGNQQVLYLDGKRSYAVVPAVDISTTSFTLSCWIKIPSYSNSHGAIFGDWSSPYPFRIYVNPNGGFCAQLRRNGPSPTFDMITKCRYLHLNHILFFTGKHFNNHPMKQRGHLRS